MQAQAAKLKIEEEQRAKARQEAKDEMRSSGATCEIDCLRADSGRGACEVPAIGRCAICHRTFCESHASVNRSETVAFAAINDAGLLTECRECQDQKVGRLTDEARARAAKAETARNTERNRREQQRRDHERQVVEWEELNDWPGKSKEIAKLDERIIKLYRAKTAARSSLAGAVIVGVFDLAAFFTAIAGAVADNNEVAAAGLLLLLIMIFPTVLTSLAVMRWHRHQQRESCIRLRKVLMEARGCGDPSCAECNRPRFSPPSTLI